MTIFLMVFVYAGEIMIAQNGCRLCTPNCAYVDNSEAEMTLLRRCVDSKLTAIQLENLGVNSMSLFETDRCHSLF